jgi:DNA-damage-inducible protein D
MSKEILIIGQHKDFESIKKIDENGIEYWTGRELMELLDYTEWRNFNIVIDKARRSCFSSSQNVEDHFVGINKMVKIGSSSIREIKDYNLDRYACYLIAQNGDPSKKEIAMAQTYFAIQARKQEIVDNLSGDDIRIYKRGEVSNRNKVLFSTAKLSGVSNFGKFNDASYKGLYTMGLSEIEKKKGIKKGELLDRAGSEELGANMFRITQIEAKLKRENIKGDTEAQRTHFDVGKKVRDAMRDLGSEMPENLKSERHIKELKKGKRSSQKRIKKENARIS